MKINPFEAVNRRNNFKKKSTVKTVENGQLAAKKFSIDCPDCVLQIRRRGKVKLKLKTLPALQALSN